jgi:hypothetical protein
MQLSRLRAAACMAADWDASITPPSCESTSLPTTMAGDLAMKSGCSRCNERWQRHYDRRHRHHDRRHTSPAIILHMARLSLESTKCSSSGCYHLRRGPIKWVDNLACHTSSGGMPGCRLKRWHQGGLRAIPAIVLHMARNRLERMKCSSSGWFHLCWPVKWVDNLARRTSSSRDSERGGRCRN